MKARAAEVDALRGRATVLAAETACQVTSVLNACVRTQWTEPHDLRQDPAAGATAYLTLTMLDSNLHLTSLPILQPERHLFACTQEARLDQFRLVMNWNRDELAQWALAHTQREEDALALEAYRRRVCPHSC